MTKEALKLALDRVATTSKGFVIVPDDAFKVIKEALAQPEQEPVAKKKHEPTIDLGKYAGTYGGYIKEKNT